MPRKSKHDASGRFVMQLKERRERALQLRIDGLSLRQISAEVGIDPANLCEYFKEYKSESIKALREELFDMQTQRLMELWRAAVADVRNFVPVCDAKGNPIVVPVLDEDGQPVFDEDGNPCTQIMRDHGVKLNAINVAARITAQISAHFGLDAPSTTMLLTAANEDREVVFRVIDATDGAAVTVVTSDEP